MHGWEPQRLATRLLIIDVHRAVGIDRSAARSLSAATSVYDNDQLR
jgi:hypothetical protein